MTDHKIINPNDVVSLQQVERIYHGIQNRTLPKKEWSHGAHLCAGTALLHDLGLEEAERVMPDMIRRYNEATGVQNTDSDGYHHTITMFYLRAITGFLDGRFSEPLNILATDVLQSKLAEKTYPLIYYNTDLLFSVRARKTWVEPDLQPLIATHSHKMVEKQGDATP